jgi:DNA-binding MarR family transcriptional regulator
MTSSTLSGPVDADPALDLADLLGRAARRLRRGTMAHLGPLGLTMAQAKVLRSLAFGPLRMADIAARLEVVPRTVTPMVDGLETAGLARRRTDPVDRRSVLVEPTSEGRRLLAHLDEARRATAAQAFSALSTEERAALAGLLARLCDDRHCAKAASHAEAAP